MRKWAARYTAYRGWLVGTAPRPLPKEMHMGAHNKLQAMAQGLRLQLEPWFSADTAAPGTQWRGAPRSIGHCAAVALIFQASIGGDLMSTYIEGVSHWFNRVREGERWVDVDL